ncbi:heterogeneous nuclear ribonucleoprotein A1-like isoform X2 [Atheta coriaria]|uniref:heterogeneous nuclear ribonucleoprotein A1-like isoform X2 n=1 Tax=Dalotia coriaria TaxID=877792 RepID=UPI0031F477AD
MSRRSEHSTKVFVGSLPPNVTAEDLRQLFAPYGTIAECDIANRCGFLHLEDKDLAEKAIAELNNSTFMGARISVEMGRVKPRGERRMRGGGMGGGRGGGMGRKRDMGPYARDGGNFGRGGMARNGGGYRDDYRGFDEYQDYERYDDRYDRRPPMYDDGRGGRGGGSGGYMNDRGSYGNGYDRRPYDDRSGQFSGNMPPARPYDDNRMQPSGPGAYDDRRTGGMNDRRPLIDEQNMNQGQMRQQGYERPPQAQTDMFSRRDGPPKPITTGGYDRSAQAGSYTAYGQTNTTNYGTAAPAAAASYGTPINNYNQQMPAGGYGDTRGAPSQSYDTRGQAPMSNPGYASAQTGYNTAPAAGPAGGYGDNYGMRAQSNTYDTAYPPLPQQQRGYSDETCPT